MYTVLDVGSGSKAISLPDILASFQRTRLDIDPLNHPDIVGDLCSPPEHLGGTFDAVYASHVLEHIPPSSTFSALRACKKVLKEDGFLFLRVPSIELLIQQMGKAGKGFIDPLSSYVPAMPGEWTGNDLLFGAEAEGTMGHRRHFTQEELMDECKRAGFTRFVGGYAPQFLEIILIGFGDKLNRDHRLKIIDAFGENT